MELDPQLLEMLCKIYELKKVCFYQSPHWDHQPTVKEIQDEKNYEKECQKKYYEFCVCVQGVKDYLMGCQNRIFIESRGVSYLPQDKASPEMSILDGVCHP